MNVVNKYVRNIRVMGLIGLDWARSTHSMYAIHMIHMHGPCHNMRLEPPLTLSFFFLSFFRSFSLKVE